MVDVQRAGAADAAAREAGLAPGVGSAELAAAVQPPWTGVLVEHRDALLALTRELGALAESNRTLIGRRAAGRRGRAGRCREESRDATASVGYDARGRSDLLSGAGPIVVDGRCEARMTGFSSLNTAVTGLYAAQRAMDVTGQNIVNANTPGYSRQRAVLTEIGSATSSSLFTGNGANNGGVNVATVARIKDAFVEGARVAAGARRQAALGGQTGALTGVEQLLGEPGETGLQSTIDSFYAAWHDLANNPTDVAKAGSVVIQRGISVTDQLRALSDGIAGRWSTAHDALGDVVRRPTRRPRTSPTSTARSPPGSSPAGRSTS